MAAHDDEGETRTCAKCGEEDCATVLECGCVGCDYCGEVVAPPEGCNACQHCGGVMPMPPGESCDGLPGDQPCERVTADKGDK